MTQALEKGGDYVALGELLALHLRLGDLRDALGRLLAHIGIFALGQAQEAVGQLMLVEQFGILRGRDLTE